MLKNNRNVEVKYVCDVNDERGGEAIAGLTQLQGYAPSASMTCADFRGQGRGRGPDFHARALALRGGGLGLPGRQGRLCREMFLDDDLGGAQAG